MVSKNCIALSVLALVIALIHDPTGPVSAASAAASGQTCTIVGTSAGEVLTGTAGNDVICGMGGNDTINASGGNDVIDAGLGNDVVNAGEGNDTMIGGSGADKLRGDSGNDVISGGVGDDTISGGNGNDTISGDAGQDVNSGGSGSDVLSGGDGNDSLTGDSGNDKLLGGDGSDVAVGGDGSDVISGGSGNDNLKGSAGDDRITGDAGNDRVFGEDGKDTADGGSGTDFIAGGLGTDSLSGGVGDDTLTGDSGVDRVDGNQGQNTCDLDSGDVAANCLEDVVGPEVLDFNITENGQAIDLSKPNAVLHATIRIKENFGKVKVAQFGFQTGSGQSARSVIFAFTCGYNGCTPPTCKADGLNWCSYPARIVSGSRFDGVYAVDVDVSGLTKAGKYEFVYGSLVDALGNPGTLASGVEAKIKSQAFTITGLPEDPNREFVPPTLSSISLESEPESGQGQSITVTFAASDEGSGVSEGTVFYQNLDSTATHRSFAVEFSASACGEVQNYESGVWSMSIPVACLISGNINEGVYRATFTLPRGYAFGDYFAKYARVIDLAGNETEYSTAGEASPLGQKWHRDEFQYTSSEDYQAPRARAYLWSRSDVNTGTKDELIFLDVSYTEVSGIREFNIGIKPVGKNVEGIGIYTWSNLQVSGNIQSCSAENTGVVYKSGSAFTGGCQVSGDEYSGVMRFGIVLPRASASGPWDITWTNFSDMAGNGEQIFEGFNNPFTNTPTN
jgi:hypothetical protein